MLKIKDKKELEDLLNNYYNFYVLEDDENLDNNAKELKYSLKCVIDFLILQNGLEGDDKIE